MPPLLELREVSIRFGSRRRDVQALDGISLTVSAGSSVGLVGESGSGKTTVARAVLGLVPVGGGRIIFDGRDITNIGFKERRALYRDMQIVFQDPYSSLNPDRSVASTLAEPLQSFRVETRQEIRRRVADALEQVHLPPGISSAYPSELSGGQRQRVAIARALILRPRLVICDEAVSALDLSVQAQILDLLKELQGRLDLSYLFISHDLDVVTHLCDETVVLYRGRVMEFGPTAQLIRGAAHPYTEALQQAAPLPNPRLQRERRPRQRGRAPLSDMPGGCVFAPRCPYALAACRQEQPELRAIEAGGVACQRYPAWRGESKSPSNGGSVAHDIQLPEVQ